MKTDLKYFSFGKKLCCGRRNATEASAASNRTRIIISRWSDECDAEYLLRACRRRSDGRLKRHISCDDLRAWVNDSCIKYEYLLDLMSDGEFVGGPPFRLYGRFIPVPILFKLTQGTTVTGEDHEADKATGGRRNRVTSSKSETGKHSQYSEQCTQANKFTSKTRSQSYKSESKTSFSGLEWEKNLLEKRLCECTCLLNKAVQQLETIDNLVGCPEEESNNERNEEIRDAFYTSKVLCTCTTQKSPPGNIFPSKSFVKKFGDSIKYAELMRKVSGLRAKLKKVQECRHEIEQQIRLSTTRTVACGSSNQVTELYNHKEQAHEKRLHKKLEKLMAERGRLLFEMCQSLKCLKSLKKLSRSSLNPAKKNTTANRNSNDPQRACTEYCRCRCSEPTETTDSEQVQCSESSFRATSLNPGYVNYDTFDSELTNDYEPDDVETPCGDEFPDDESFNSDHSGGGACDGAETENCAYLVCSSATEVFDASRQKPNKNQRNEKRNLSCVSENAVRTADSAANDSRKSKVLFSCPQRACKRVLNADDVSAYERSISPEQQVLIEGALKHIENSRPSTSPTTKKERDTMEYRADGQICDCSRNERQVKSETTMKEIEKTLRNYELRLCELDSLECRVEELKKKSSEARRYKEDLEKLKCEVRVQGEFDNVERERSRREMTKLCEENWELKRQVEQLTIMFEAQYKKIRNMKCGMVKARELECETEELKKELSEYRDSYNQQRKCISKWESVVALQRTEIEQLMNHIRELTTAKEESHYPSKKNMHSSRSCHPEVKVKRGAGRAKTGKRNCLVSSSEEGIPCCCNEFLQEESRCGSQQESSDVAYSCCPPSTRGMEWCN